MAEAFAADFPSYLKVSGATITGYADGVPASLAIPAGITKIGDHALMGLHGDKKRGSAWQRHGTGAGRVFWLLVACKRDDCGGRDENRQFAGLCLYTFSYIPFRVNWSKICPSISR